MTRPKQSTVIPPLTNWGGVRSVQRRLERSSTIMANKGKGGLWFGMSIVSGVSAVVGYALNYFKH